MATGGYRLLGCRGCGSVIVEAAFGLAGIGYDYEEVDYEQPGPARDRLFSLNPLGQVPTLIMPDGSVMTESAAILLMIGDLAPAAGLVPAPDAPERAPFLRWLMFLVAAIYPTFTYGDEPRKWVPDGATDALRASTDQHRQALWRQVESEIEPRPWFLGERFSALDLYIGAMVHWRPRRDWFRRECPKLSRVADRTLAVPAVSSVYRTHFA